MLQVSKKKYIVSAGKSENQKLTDLNITNNSTTKKIFIRNIFYYDTATAANIIEIRYSGLSIANVSNDKFCFLYKHSAGLYLLGNQCELGEMDSNITNKEFSLYLFDENTTSLTSNGILFIELLISN